MTSTSVPGPAAVYSPLQIDAAQLPRPLQTDSVVAAVAFSPLAVIAPLRYREAVRLQRTFLNARCQADIYGVRGPWWVPMGQRRCQKVYWTHAFVAYSLADCLFAWRARLLTALGAGRYLYRDFAVVIGAPLEPGGAR